MVWEGSYFKEYPKGKMWKIHSLNQRKKKEREKREREEPWGLGWGDEE